MGWRERCPRDQRLGPSHRDACGELLLAQVVAGPWEGLGLCRSKAVFVAAVLSLCAFCGFLLCDIFPMIPGPSGKFHSVLHVPTQSQLLLWVIGAKLGQGEHGSLGTAPHQQAEVTSEHQRALAAS